MNVKTIIICPTFMFWAIRQCKIEPPTCLTTAMEMKGSWAIRRWKIEPPACNHVDLYVNSQTSEGVKLTKSQGVAAWSSSIFIHYKLFPTKLKAPMTLSTVRTLVNHKIGNHQKKKKKIVAMLTPRYGLSMCIYLPK